MRPPTPPESLISCLRSKVILDDLETARIAGDSSVVVFNTESIYYYFTNADYRNYVARCSHVAIDGIGLKLTLRLFGESFGRYHGPELLARIIELRGQWSIMVAGGNAANRKLVELGQVERYIDLPFTQDYDEIAKRLRFELSGFKPTHSIVVVLISLGLPKQEIVASRLLDEPDCRSGAADQRLVIVPVGAAIDFLTGTKIRAGRAWQKLGLEWLPRLIREPRMIPRVFRSAHGMALLVSSELRSLMGRLSKVSARR